MAKNLNVPLKLETTFIDQVVKAQIFTGKNSTLRFNDDGSGCQFVELSNPKVNVVAKKLKIRVKAIVKVGRRIGATQCIFAINWKGYVDLYHTVKIAAGGKQLKIVVVKSEILTLQQKKDHLGGAVWQGLQSQLYPKLHSLVIDLRQPIESVKQVLPYVVAERNSQLVKKSLDSIVINEVKLEESGALIDLLVKVPDLKPIVETRVTKLSQVELSALENKLNAVDAFVTFTLKHFLQASLSEEVRDGLFNVLFDVRYTILDILEDPEKAGPDPVRKLFLESWQKMSPLIRLATNQYRDQALVIHVLSFVTASDALAAIDQYAPEIGLDLSVDGLRRLARLLNENSKIDPIQRDEKVDPVLREMFGLSQVIVEPQSGLHELWLDFFIKSAVAANETPTELPAELTEKLNNWVPKKHELNRYLPMVKKVLDSVTQLQLAPKKLEKSHRKVFQNLVYAAAWQESCWKQFANIKGFRRPVESYSGDLGLMQINPRVWRGFYDLHKLKWDIVYNANAGAEILFLYLTKYVIKNKEHIKTGKLENLARATYSGYNGGPSQYTRYRNKSISGKLKQIDSAFYKKYIAIRDKGAMSVKSCYAGI